MRFNMGCGRNRLDGFHNVDSQPGAAADEVWDLEKIPWPWPSASAEEVRFIHSLEHMGQDPRVFLAIMRELYRICRPGALVRIEAPHPRHDDYLNDPTHVRPITPDMMSLFDRELNDRWLASGSPNSPLAHYLDVDFPLRAVQITLAEPYHTDLAQGRITKEEAADLMRSRWNVARAFSIVLEARKPSPGPTP